MSILTIRPLVTADLPELIRIDRDSYRPEYRESDAAFLSKIALFRAGSLACCDGDQLCGYVFALPWTAGRLIGVGEVVEALPDRPTLLYLHDLVVAPAHRGRGIASRLLADVLRVAAGLGLDPVVLVAVQGSEPFWEHAGFRVVDRFEYVPGCPASRMERALAHP